MTSLWDYYRLGYRYKFELDIDTSARARFRLEAATTCKPTAISVGWAGSESRPTLAIISAKKKEAINTQQ